MRVAASLVVLAVACDGGAPPRPPAPPGPVRPTRPPAVRTADPAPPAIDEGVAALAAAAMPCEPVAVADRFHLHAWPERLLARASAREAVASRLDTAARLGGEHLCAWLARMRSYELVVVRAGDVFVLRAAGSGSFDYHELHGQRDRRGTWRLVDVRSHRHARWLSDEVVDRLAVEGGDPVDAEAVERARELDRAGQPAAALQALTGLSAAVEDSWTVYQLRLDLAGRVSDAEVTAAWKRHANLHPVRDPTPLWRMVIASQANRPGDALRHLDDVSQTVGGDPFLDAQRAMLLARRGDGDDLDVARALARRSVERFPDHPYAWWAELMLAQLHGEWAAFLTANDRLRELGVGFTDEKLATERMFVLLRASPEYAAWKAARAPGETPAD